MSKRITEHTTVFTCCSQDFDPGEPIRKHLKEAHGLTELKGTKRLTLALDGDEYCNVYDIAIGGIIFQKTCRGPKR